jgi:pantetheine-phosphate adenylyltransferase
MKPRRAIYPGSFDPITLGHVDVARRAARLFDEVVVAVYEGNEKSGALFTPPERIALAREVLGSLPESNIVVDSFSGLTVDYARSQGAGVIVRGLRAVPILHRRSKLSA